MGDGAVAGFGLGAGVRVWMRGALALRLATGLTGPRAASAREKFWTEAMRFVLGHLEL